MYGDPDILFILVFEAYPVLEVPKTPFWPIFSCIRGRGERGSRGQIRGDCPLLNSIYKIRYLDWRVAGFRADPILMGPRETRLPVLQSLQVPVIRANELEKPPEGHLSRRKHDKPKVPFLLLFIAHPIPKRRKYRGGHRYFGLRGRYLSRFL